MQTDLWSTEHAQFTSLQQVWLGEGSAAVLACVVLVHRAGGRVGHRLVHRPLGIQGDPPFGSAGFVVGGLHAESMRMKNVYVAMLANCTNFTNVFDG